MKKLAPFTALSKAKNTHTLTSWQTSPLIVPHLAFCYCYRELLSLNKGAAVKKMPGVI